MTILELAAIRAAAAERAQRGPGPTLKDVAADARELASMLAAEAGGGVHVEFRAGQPVLVAGPPRFRP